MTIIEATDRHLIHYIENKFDNLGIPYTKVWRSKHSDYQTDNEPFILDGFIIIYEFDSLKAMRYKDKIAQDFISKREYLEKCFNSKSYIKKG